MTTKDTKGGKQDPEQTADRLLEAMQRLLGNLITQRGHLKREPEERQTSNEPEAPASGETPSSAE